MWGGIENSFNETSGETPDAITSADGQDKTQTVQKKYLQHYSGSNPHSEVLYFFVLRILIGYLREILE